jgi:23S rRNA U2552 (ribose-2'-O)-methylase RlmE/FtsJ
MLYYELPKLNNNRLIPSYFKIKISTQNNIFVNENTYNHLIQSKKLIETKEHLWKKYKKYTNPYEFIHTPYDENRIISKMKPLSRAFYKMVEIANFFNIFKKYESQNIKTFHLAEGPGGFIEAFTFLRNKKNNFFKNSMPLNTNDTYYGMTLTNEQNKSIPGWSKSKYFLNTNPNVIIETGKTCNGDLYSLENLKYCKEKYGGEMDIITGDGGFDFSVDFNNQELNASKLIFSQIMFAISMQKKGGIFVLKVFDIFTKISMDFLYLLNDLYDEVYVCKPQTSRYANSEKYIVCKGYNSIHSDVFSRLVNIYTILMDIDIQKQNVESILSNDIEDFFINTINEVNCIFGEQQIRTIHETIDLVNNTYINTEYLKKIKKQNIQKCLSWCKEHKIPCNEYKKSNIFLQSSEC